MSLEQYRFVQGLVVGAGGTLLFLFILLLLRPWVKSVLSGAPLSIYCILGMRLRGNSPVLLVDVYVTLIKRGVPVSIGEVEAVYMTQRSRARTSDALADLVQNHPAILNRQKAMQEQGAAVR